MIDGPPDAGLHGAGPHDESLGALFQRAIADVEQVARAEIELHRARAVAKVDAARGGAIMLAGAVATGSVALTALVVGVLLIVARELGPLWATVIVVGVLIVVTGLLGWFGLQHFKRVFGASGGA